MRDRVFALLVHENPEHFETLKATLKELSVGTYCVRTCGEAERLIAATQPCLVFTGASLPDGSWVEIINLADAAEIPIDVIVVGSSGNGRLHSSVMERGAFAFILPPFGVYSLAQVVRLAEQDVRNRREALARLAA